MGDKTGIQWADHTFNPWVGCTKISAACDHCYAEGWARRSGSPELWQGERRRTTAANWGTPMKWDRDAAAEGRRARVFCASLADFFDNHVPTRWRDDAWHRIDQTQSLDWLLLTKRPENIFKMLPTPAIGAPAWGEGWRNVWLGATVENRATLRRIDIVRRIPAAVHFLSIEPLLEDLGEVDLGGISWVICGGESGPSARPMHPDWARSLRDQCKAAGVPFFFKQWGRWEIAEELGSREEGTNFWRFPDGDEFHIVSDGHDIVLCAAEDAKTPKKIWRDYWGDGHGHIAKTGKAGRLLDGKEYSEFPEVR